MSVAVQGVTGQSTYGLLDGDCSHSRPVVAHGQRDHTRYVRDFTDRGTNNAEDLREQDNPEVMACELS